MIRLLERMVLIGVTVAVAGCGANTSTTSDAAEPTTSEPPQSCATPPNGRTPPGEARSLYHHGNGSLWTMLWRDGVIVADKSAQDADGSIRMKFAWWADVATKNGARLAISGNRLGAEHEELRVGVLHPAWPETAFSGTGFWTTTLTFPSAGCWEVVGRIYDGASALTTLRFTVAVKT